MHSSRLTLHSIISAAALLTLTASPARAGAPASRYTAPASGVVYDTMTKLTWQQATSPSTQDWAAAKTYCSGLPLDGGGWRLPTLKELATLVDVSRTAPAIDPVVFPNTQLGYWTSSHSINSANSAWYIQFDSGYTFISGVSSSNSARCVR